MYRGHEAKFWVLSRYEDVQGAARDWGTFSSAQGNDLDDTALLFAPSGEAPALSRAHLDPALRAAGLGAVVGGHALGGRAFARLKERRFERLLILVILCAGVASIVGGVGAL